jgi:hypothetical protein
MIDMPSAEMTSDGMLAISEGYFKGGLAPLSPAKYCPILAPAFDMRDMA